MPFQALQDLGFTGLEAEVYVRLVESPDPSTGYRLASELGKPAPNVYKAIEALAAKGALMVDDGKRRLCRAVPPPELLGRLARTFQRTCEEARESLEDRWAPTDDHRVYRLDSAEAVIERARSLLQRARAVAVADLFPLAFEVLRDDLRGAAQRGVKVSSLVYAETVCSEIDVVQDSVARVTRQRWPGEWMNLVIDGRELLIAFLDETLEQVRQAVWSRSPHLAWVSHSGMASEQVLAAVRRRVEEAGDENLKREVEELWKLKALDSPGYLDLMRSIGKQPNPEEE